MSKQFDPIDRPLNPLDGKVFNTPSESRLVLSPAANCVRFNLRIAQSDLANASKAFGLEIPSKIGEMNSKEQTLALCVGPDEWILMAPESVQQTLQAGFAKIDKAIIYSLVDVGHRTVGIDITGTAATQILNSGCPLDFDKMPVGSCTRSVLEKAQILIIKYDKNSYRLEIVRSFSEYVWNYLCTAAGQSIGQ